LSGMSEEFASMYSRTGRPSIAPERLLRALLLQVLYTVSPVGLKPSICGRVKTGQVKVPAS
jgi:hypothetical protein